ncbi:MAG: hypothetical protein WEB06_05005 [Actinomycetota bacterium]
MDWVGRFPLVDRDEIVRAFRPGTTPKERTFRTLRKRGLISRGFRIQVRRRNRLAGQVWVYSALNLDAAVLARHGDDEEAVRVATEAEKQEARWETRLADVAVALELPLETLQAFKDLRNQLVHELLPLAQEIERVRDTFKPLKDLIDEQFGIVKTLSESWASLEILSSAHQIVEVKRLLTEASSIAIGDFALLRSELFQGQSLLELVPAVWDPNARRDLPSSEEATALSQHLTELLEPVEPSPAVWAELRKRRAAGDTVRIPTQKIRILG